MKWMLRLLPQDTRDLIELGQRMLESVDTPEERREVIRYGKQMLSDGRVEVGEWARFGSKLGILKARKVGTKRPRIE
jgi:hypothetical protein